MLTVSPDLYADIFISPAEARATACTCSHMRARVRVWGPGGIFIKKPLYVAPHNPNNAIITSPLHVYKYDVGPSKIKMWYDDKYVWLSYRVDARYDTPVGYSPKTQLYACVDAAGAAGGPDCNFGRQNYSTFVWLWRIFGLDWADLPRR